MKRPNRSLERISLKLKTGDVLIGRYCRVTDAFYDQDGDSLGGQVTAWHGWPPVDEKARQAFCREIVRPLADKISPVNCRCFDLAIDDASVTSGFTITWKHPEYERGFEVGRTVGKHEGASQFVLEILKEVEALREHIKNLL